MSNIVFSQEEVQSIKKRWLDDNKTAGLYDLIQMAGQAVLQSPEIQAGCWQPITTAPKDGTWVRLWRKPIQVGCGSPEIIGIYHSFNGRAEPAWVWPVGAYDPYTERGRLAAMEEIEGRDCFRDNSFTHWMPLPEPPVRAAMEVKP